MYFFTADEHYGHKNIIKYCDRPFKSVHEMNEEIIHRHNSKVQKNDIVVHAGDFSLLSEKDTYVILRRLNGNHVFLQGDHDKWLKNSVTQIWTKKIDGIQLVVCHYCMRTWPLSHYNSWQLFAHNHGTLEPIGKQWDIGVDNNNFYPLSFDDIKNIMKDRPDNFNLVSKSH